jgi:urease accessory protein
MFAMFGGILCVDDAGALPSAATTHRAPLRACASMNPADSDWLLWQLADSAFPSGSFAHSAGLEAARQLGEVEGAAEFTDFLKASLLQAACASAPFALAVRADPMRLEDLDRRFDAFLSNRVANRASRAQGQAFLAAASRTLGGGELRVISDRVRQQSLPGHWPVIFGAIGGSLGLDATRLARLLLFITLRGLISAGVRLGVVGPIQAQTLQFELHAHGELLVERALNCDLDDAAQPSPLVELMQGVHDRLYSRLFVS